MTDTATAPAVPATPVAEAVVPRVVPNAWPTLPFNGLAIVGEAPGADEEAQGMPFVGASGHRLNHLLGVVGIDRQACYVGNVCQRRPPGNDITKAPQAWLGEGFETLVNELAVLKPRLVLCLGNTPLQWLSGDDRRRIGDWRGSLWQSQIGQLWIADVVEWKCMATYHPAATLRQPEWLPVMRFDLRRAAEELTREGMDLPVRDIRVASTIDEAIGWIEGARMHKGPHAVDLEGGVGNMTCISFSYHASSGWVIPFAHNDTSVWSHDDEVRILEALKAWLEDPACPKVLQNSLYDAFVLAWSYGITIVNIADDTMLKWWEQWCELEKGLAFQASILTREPFYKAERKSDDAHVADVYCGKDSCVTFEVNERLAEMLAKDAGRTQHYRFNMELLPALLYMELTGFAFDTRAARAKAKEVQREVWVLQHELNTVSGRANVDVFAKCVKAFVGKPTRKVEVARVSTKTGKALKPTTRCVPVEVTTWDLLREYRLDSCDARVEEAWELSRDIDAFVPQPGEAQSLSATEAQELFVLQGHLSQVVGYHLNVDAPATLATYLYDELALPRHYKKEGNRNTTRLTTDNLALVNLFRQTASDPTKQRVVELVLKLRALMTQLETLTKGADPDGHIRCGYNLVGTDTGRLSCYESPTGSGFNLQTVTKKFRGLFSACPFDDEHIHLSGSFVDDSFSIARAEWLAQCDLAGADSWTVAAHCAANGDPTMLDDLRAGIKPAKVVALMYERGAAVMSLSRDELKTACKGVDGDGWVYFACKSVTHGVAYGEGDQTISDSILTKSYKLFGTPIYVPTSKTRELRQLFLRRYTGVERWHMQARTLLETKGQATGATGHTRVFFAPRREHSTLRAWLANEPQENTTYACNLALHRLWYDPTNRRDGSSLNDTLRVRPLHVVHDALLTAFPTHIKVWARGKHHEWFHNTLVIAGRDIVIPFEGRMGPTWGELVEDV